jgi:hypothetical protein
MANNIEHNPPAFPVLDSTLGDFRDGMSLRDYFAGQAIIGLLAETAEAASYGRLRREQYASFASECYGLADAMLAARGQS